MGFKRRISTKTVPLFDVFEFGGRVVASMKHGAQDSLVELPYEISGNYGGRDIYLSASGRYAAVAMYSGQSENAYAVFDIANGIDTIICSGWEYGYCVAAAFSPREDLIVFANTLNPMLGPADDLADTTTIKWARLDAFRLPAGQREQFPIDVIASGEPEDGYFDLAGESYLREMAFDSDRLVVATPSGESAFVELRKPGMATWLRPRN